MLRTKMKLTFCLIVAISIAHAQYDSSEEDYSYIESGRKLLFDKLKKATEKVFQLPKKIVKKGKETVKKIINAPIRIIEKLEELEQTKYANQQQNASPERNHPNKYYNSGKGKKMKPEKRPDGTEIFHFDTKNTKEVVIIENDKEDSGSVEVMYIDRDVNYYEDVPPGSEVEEVRIFQEDFSGNLNLDKSSQGQIVEEIIIVQQPEGEESLEPPEPSNPEAQLVQEFSFEEDIQYVNILEGMEEDNDYDYGDETFPYAQRTSKKKKPKMYSEE